MLPALLVLLCVYFVPAASRAEDMPTAKMLLDRSIAASGPVPPNFRESIVADGSSGELKQVTFRNGPDERHTFDRGGLHSESGTYHGEAWEQTNNGLTVIVEKDPGTGIPDPTTTTVTRVTQPFDAYVVSVLNVRNIGTRTYYDSANFRVRRVDNITVTGTTIETVDEFAAFGMRTLAKRWTLTTPGSAVAEQYERTEYVAGAAADADIQEPPTRRALVEFPPGSGGVDLPITHIDSTIFVRVSIGKRTVDFLLDTGTSGIFIDPALAKDLGLRLVNQTVHTNARSYIGSQAIVPEMRVATLRMHDVAVSVAPISEGGPLNVKMLGILGFDFLAQLGVTIDYQHNRVHVVPADAYVAPSDPSTFALDIRLGALVPMVTVTIPGAVAERSIVDTGCDCTFAFFDYFARRYPKAFQHDLGPTLSYGAGGRVGSEVFRFHELHLGAMRFNDASAMRFSARSFSSNADGLIGNHLLSLFTVDLDYERGRVYLTPSTGAKQRQEHR
jgi:predicted aspartyl protease